MALFFDIAKAYKEPESLKKIHRKDMKINTGSY